MPLWSRVIGLLRQRIVLGIIFSLSMIYCGLSLYSERKGLTFQVSNDISSTNILIDDNNIDIMDDDDSIVSDKIQWNSNSFDINEKENIFEKEIFNINKTDTILKKTCQNSIQGKTLIVDDRGYVCARNDILPNGCCKIENEQDKNTSKNDIYSCKNCNPQGCCTVYEYCVSCCLHPTKHLKMRKKSESDSKYKENLKLRRGEDILRLKIRYLDRFQICLAACRTSSASVHHENTYKDPYSKYCYITNHVSSLLESQHLFRRDLVSVNKNFNISVVVPAKSVNSSSILSNSIR